MTIVFIIFAIVAFVGFAIQARRRNGHGMAYSLAVAAIWAGAAVWWSRG